jgi:hypothetical protein
MPKLYGAQRMVLQALLDAAGNSASFIEDSRLAQATRIAIGDMRNWLETLEGDDYINLARTETGFSASLTAKGRLALGLLPPAATSSPGHGSGTASSPAPVTTAPSVRTILILAANPRETERLRLDEEVKKIEQGLERSRKRDQFRLVAKWAVTVDDLRRALLDHEPEIVHFAGHGSGDRGGGGAPGRDFITAAGGEQEGVAFENDSGQVQLISSDALARLFALCSGFVRCVVFNACYSEAQASAVARHIDYVIGMTKAIGDAAAIQFAVGFYDALGAGRDFKTAFQFGCSAIDLKGSPDYMTPVLKEKSQAVPPVASDPIR